MRRDPGLLTGRLHDLLVVGGGIYGAWIAWDATLRGLSVAIVERDDFGSNTSANSLRIAHGGLRYLARGDLARMRESIRERSTLLRVAPGLVVPLPVLVPTRGAGTKGRAAMRAALALNDLGSLGRNRGLDHSHGIPRGRVLSRREAVRRFPPLDGAAITGAALWHDARILSPERLTLSLVRSAADRGAAAANYVRMERLCLEGGTVRGVEAVDRATGASLAIRARAVALAAGPWTGSLLPGGAACPAPGQYALAVNLIVGRELASVAVALQAPTGPSDDPVIGGYRYLFLAPQDGCTLLGTWYGVDDGSDPRALAERGAETLRAEFRAACPGLGLGPAEPVRVQAGRLPLKAGLERGRRDALADRPRVLHHGGSGLEGVFTVEGVKLTTARGVAEQAVTRILRRLGRPDPGCHTAETALTGAWAVPAADPRLHARLREAAREEMALTLADVVYRRTGLGEPPGPSRETVAAAARVVGPELGWTAAREAAEIDDVMRQARVGAATPVEAVV